MRLTATEIAIIINICDYEDLATTRVIKHW